MLHNDGGDSKNEGIDFSDLRHMRSISFSTLRFDFLAELPIKFEIIKEPLKLQPLMGSFNQLIGILQLDANKDLITGDLMEYLGLLTDAHKSINSLREIKSEKISQGKLDLHRWLLIKAEENLASPSSLFIGMIRKLFVNSMNTEDELLIDNIASHAYFILKFIKDIENTFVLIDKKIKALNINRDHFLELKNAFYRNIEKSYSSVERDKFKKKLQGYLNSLEKGLAEKKTEKLTEIKEELTEALSPNQFQGMKIFSEDPESLSVRSTTLIKFSRGEELPLDISAESKKFLIKAAKDRLKDKVTFAKPAVGDIIFFDGNNDGNPVIKFGNEQRVGIPGTGRFTHVSIVVGIDENGTALIAETGGAGVAFMRQATIRHLQSGQIFRPNKELAKRIGRIAFNTTKYELKTYLDQLENFLKKKPDIEFRRRLDSVIEKAVNYFFKNIKQKINNQELIAKIKKELIIKTKKNKKSIIKTIVALIENEHAKKLDQLTGNGYIIPQGEYSVAGMLASPLSEKINQRVQQPFYHAGRYENRDRPIFGGYFTKRWCSSFAMNVIAYAYLEQLHEEDNKPNSNKDAKTHEAERIRAIEKAFAEPSHLKEYDLLNIAPKTLYQILQNANHGEKLFNRLGSWVNFDDQDPGDAEERLENYRYNEAKPTRAANPYSKANKFNYSNPMLDVEEKKEAALKIDNFPEKQAVLAAIYEYQIELQDLLTRDLNKQNIEVYKQLTILAQRIKDSIHLKDLLLIITEALATHAQVFSYQIPVLEHLSHLRGHINLKNPNVFLAHIIDKRIAAFSKKHDRKPMSLFVNPLNANNDFRIKKDYLINKVIQEIEALKQAILNDEINNLSFLQKISYFFKSDNIDNAYFNKVHIYEQLCLLLNKLKNARDKCELFGCVADVIAQSQGNLNSFESEGFFVQLLEDARVITQHHEEIKKVKNDVPNDVSLLRGLKDRALYICQSVQEKGESDFIKKEAKAFQKMVSAAHHSNEAVGIYHDFFQKAYDRYAIERGHKGKSVISKEALRRFIIDKNSQFYSPLAETLQELQKQETYRSILPPLKSIVIPKPKTGFFRSAINKIKNLSPFSKGLLTAATICLATLLALTVVGAVIEGAVVVSVLVFAGVGGFIGVGGTAGVIAGAALTGGVTGAIAGVNASLNSEKRLPLSQKSDLPLKQASTTKIIKHIPQDKKEHREEKGFELEKSKEFVEVEKPSAIQKTDHCLRSPKSNFRGF